MLNIMIPGLLCISMLLVASTSLFVVFKFYGIIKSGDVRVLKVMCKYRVSQKKVPTFDGTQRKSV